MGDEGETSVEVSEEETTKVTSEEVDIEESPEHSTEGPGIGSRIKNWIIILLILAILVPAATFWMWKTGVDSLKSDNIFLIVVQDKGVAKAGSIYDLSQNKAELINVGVLPPVKDKDDFLADAIKQSGRAIDRLIVIRVETITKLSTEPSLGYTGKQIPSRDVPGYLTGSLHDEVLRGDDPEWEFRANLLSNWIEVYSNRIQDASFGSHAYNVIFSEFRGGAIEVYPRNRALIIIKYVPIEQILL